MLYVLNTKRRENRLQKNTLFEFLESFFLFSLVTLADHGEPALDIEVARREGG